MSNATRNITPIKVAWKKQKISIIILAAGEANRMKSQGPRPLLRITTSKNLITYQLDIIEKCIPICEIVLVCGYEADKVMDNTPDNIIKVENENYHTNNVLRSIGIGLRAVTTDKVLLLYGDLLFNIDTLANIRLEESCVFIDSANLFSLDAVGCTFNKDSCAEYFSYDLPNKWVQMAFLTGRELQIIKHFSWNKEKERLFGFEALNEIINQNGVLKYQSPKNMRIMDIDSSKDLQNIKNII